MHNRVSAGLILAGLLLAAPAAAAPATGSPNRPPPSSRGDEALSQIALEDRARQIVDPLIEGGFNNCARAQAPLMSIARSADFDRMSPIARRLTLISLLICHDDQTDKEAVWLATKLDAIAEAPLDQAVANYPLMLQDLRADRDETAARRLLPVLDGLPELVGDWEPGWFAPMVRAADKDPALEQALLSRLIAVEWTNPSLRDMARSDWRALLARNQAAARKYAALSDTLKPVTSPRILVAVAVDRRFEPVWRELQADNRFDWAAVAEAEVARLRKSAADQPRRLEIVVELMGALRLIGRAEEAIKVGEAARDRLTDPKAFDDQADNANWLHNELAYAYSDVERAAEAEAAFHASIAAGDAQGDRISQRVNWAAYLVRQGRGAEALPVLDQIGDGDGSPYGLLWRESGRVCALASNDRAKADALMDRIAPRWDDNPSAIGRALLCLDRIDEAADLLVKRLRSERHRDTALLAAVAGPRPPKGDYEVRMRQRREAVLAKPEVIKALDTYGRRLTVPYVGGYWGLE